MTTSKDNKWIIKIVDALTSPIEYSGNHRKEQWERGWKENLDEHSSIPRYFGKYPVVRKDGELIDAPPGFEYQQLVDLEKKVFTKYLKTQRYIYEFGCGTGHNLLTLHEINPKASLFGMDWASSSVESVSQLGFMGLHYDMFNPTDAQVDGNAIFTVAALEQLGTKFGPFLNYLLSAKPEICVHLEPIKELMNPENLLDFLQIKYMEKRKYLSGFLSRLQQLERAKKVKIIEASRNGVGSLFIEGYSLIVWKPL